MPLLKTMAKSPRNSLPHFGGSSQTKTLYLPAPGKLGVVVKMFPTPSKSERRFENAAAALAWCEKERVNLVYFFPDETAQN